MAHRVPMVLMALLALSVKPAQSGLRALMERRVLMVLTVFRSLSKALSRLTPTSPRMLWRGTASSWSPMVCCMTLMGLVTRLRVRVCRGAARPVCKASLEFKAQQG
jgi:hypothetical protein